MTQNVSPFDQDKLIWAMGEWLKCQTLNAIERGMVIELRQAAETSAAAWWDQAQEFCRFHSPTIFEAISKARHAGLLRNWEGFQNA